MNEISPEVRTGTIGERLVQLGLPQFGVQAAAPLKDSGNDLIALKRRNVIASVCLKGENHTILLDESEVYLIPRKQVSAI